MPITYYKRFRMEVDLDGPLPRPILPPGYVWVAWQESLIDYHAEVKYLSFRDEIDANVFPCLGDRNGCQRLMREIRRKPGFLAGATWLIACEEGYVATVQGVADRGLISAIQNLGVVPCDGAASAWASLHPPGRYPALSRLRPSAPGAYLEVTAKNLPAPP